MNVNVAEKAIRPSGNAGANGRREIYYPESDGKPMGETDWHIKAIMSLHQMLESFFRNSTDVRVFSDIMFYYEEGNPRKVIAPDVMVVREVPTHLRRTFKLWKEKPPEVVFEISSRKTWREDLERKYLIYQTIGVKEYYIFDPEYDYLKDEPLIAYHVKEGVFQKVHVDRGRVFSPALGLEVVDTNGTLRLFDPRSKRFVPSTQELLLENEKLQVELETLRKRTEPLDSKPGLK